MKVKYWAALAAVFAVAAGSAAAGPTVKKLITGQDIKDGSIGLVDLSSSTKTSLKGQRGVAGPSGSQGPKGDTGPAGPAGPKGDTGATGAAGAQGSQGPKGDTGPPGKGLTWRGAWNAGTGYVVGDAVQKGGSAYVATQANTNADPAATPASWDVLFTGVGPQGPAGPAGATGATGATGAQGAQGVQGPKGDTGAQGPKGNDGAAGPAGISGYEFDPVTLYADPVTKTNPHISSTDVHTDTATCPTGKVAISGGVSPVTVGNDSPAMEIAAPPYAITVNWSAPLSSSTWAVSWAFNSGWDWVTAELRLVCATAN